MPWLIISLYVNIFVLNMLSITQVAYHMLAPQVSWVGMWPWPRIHQISQACACAVIYQWPRSVDKRLPFTMLNNPEPVKPFYSQCRWIWCCKTEKTKYQCRVSKIQSMPCHSQLPISQAFFKQWGRTMRIEVARWCLESEWCHVASISRVCRV